MPSINPALLMNRGAPITVGAVDPVVTEKRKTIVGSNGEPEMIVNRVITWVPRTNPDDNDEPITTTEYVRFTNASLANLQNHYGSMEKFQEVSEDRPNEAVANAIAAMLNISLDDPDAMAELHAKLLPGEFFTYNMVVMAMLAMANGVDPTQAAEMLEEGRLSAAAIKAEATEAITEATAEMRAEREKAEAEDSPSTPSSPGSDPGSASDDPTPSSGI